MDLEKTKQIHTASTRMPCFRTPDFYTTLIENFWSDMTAMIWESVDLVVFSSSTSPDQSISKIYSRFIYPSPWQLPGQASFFSYLPGLLLQELSSCLSASPLPSHNSSPQVAEGICLENKNRIISFPSVKLSGGFS